MSVQAKPTSANSAYQSGSSLATGIGLYIPVVETSSDPKDWKVPVTPTYGGRSTNAPTYGSCAYGSALVFNGASTGAAIYGSGGISGNFAAATMFGGFNWGTLQFTIADMFYLEGENTQNSIGFGIRNTGLFFILAGHGTYHNLSGAIVATTGRDYLFALTFSYAGGNSSMTFYLYDVLLGTTVSESFSVAATQPTGDGSFTIAGRQSNADSFTGNILSAGYTTSIWSSGTAAQFFADPTVLVRKGSFVISSPASVVTSSTGNSIVLSGVANAPEVASAWTAGTPGSPTIAVTGGGSITAQTVASATAGTLNYTAPAGATTVTFTDPVTNWHQDLVVTAGGPATGYSMTGPSTGNVNVASTNFTVTLTPAGGTSASVTITPSDGGQGGTFTPATVALSTGTPSATFTYTPVSIGAKTISATNSLSLTNPGNLTYTVSETPIVAGTLSVASYTNTQIVVSRGTPSGGTIPLVTALYGSTDPTFALIPANLLTATMGATFTKSGLSRGQVWFFQSSCSGAGPAASGLSLYIEACTIPPRIVGLGQLGDSITGGSNLNVQAGYISDSATDFYTITTSNQGIGGETTALYLPTDPSGALITALAAMAAAFSSATEIWVPIALGRNDATGGVSVATYLANLTTIANYVLAWDSRARVILHAPIISGIGGTLSITQALVAKLAAYGAGLSSICNGTTIRLGDPNKGYEFFAARPDLLNAADLTHPTGPGYTSLAKIWADAVVTAMTPDVQYFAGSGTGASFSRIRLGY